MPSARALSQVGAGPSGRNTEEVDSDDLEVVYSVGAPGDAETEILGVESDVELHPSEGMLLKNPRSSVKAEDIKLWRYMYRIPPSVEIRVPTTYKRVDWIVPGWVSVYKLMLKDGMRFPILRLIRDVCDHLVN